MTYDVGNPCPGLGQTQKCSVIMKDNLFLHQILYLRVIFLYFLSRGPKPDFNSPFFLFGIPVVAVLFAIVKYYTSFKEITWKDFVNLYLYRGVVSFYTYLYRRVT